jgi:outer membrane receptor protein involved in Fe transport
MSSENFMANSKINLWKFRLSYGLSGNDDIGNYTSRQTYVSQNLLGMQGLVRNGIPNPALQWETSKKFNAGLDLAFMNERVAVSFDMYKSKTDNMLVYEELAAPSGFKNIATNDGSMQNTGWETSVNVRVINSANFKWISDSILETTRIKYSQYRRQLYYRVCRCNYSYKEWK